RRYHSYRSGCRPPFSVGEVSRIDRGPPFLLAPRVVDMTVVTAAPASPPPVWPPRSCLRVDRQQREARQHCHVMRLHGAERRSIAASVCAGGAPSAWL